MPTIATSEKDICEIFQIWRFEYFENIKLINIFLFSDKTPSVCVSVCFFFCVF